MSSAAPARPPGRRRGRRDSRPHPGRPFPNGLSRRRPRRRPLPPPPHRCRRRWPRASDLARWSLRWVDPPCREPPRRHRSRRSAGRPPRRSWSSAPTPLSTVDAGAVRECNRPTGRPPPGRHVAVLVPVASGPGCLFVICLRSTGSSEPCLHEFPDFFASRSPGLPSTPHAVRSPPVTRSTRWRSPTRRPDASTAPASAR